MAICDVAFASEQVGEIRQSMQAYILNGTGLQVTSRSYFNTTKLVCEQETTGAYQTFSAEDSLGEAPMESNSKRTSFGVKQSPYT
jgi:hypothetical protein